MKSIFEKDFFKWENLKTTWEARSIVLLFHLCIAASIVLYLLLSAPRAWMWGQMQWVRKDDISQLERVAAASILKKKPGEFQRWLAFRPKTDSETILDRVPSHAEDLLSSTFFELAKRAKYLGRTEEYVFWTIYARFRLRYDLLRCGSPDSIEIMNDFSTALSSLNRTDETIARVLSDAKKTRSYLQKTLDFDAKHPARNNPAEICITLNSLQKGKYEIVPEKNWTMIRHILRNATEQAIKGMSAPGKGDAP